MRKSPTTAESVLRRGPVVTALVFAGVVWGTCVASCGARTGLYANRFDSLTDAAVPDGQSAGCLYGPTLDFANGGDASENCLAGPQILLCPVASAGATVMYNYCSTNDPSCSAVSDPNCQTQCNDNEFGVRCIDSDVRAPPGCRILSVDGSAGLDGWVFCCTCNG